MGGRHSEGGSLPPALPSPHSPARPCVLVCCRLRQPVQPHAAEPQPVGGRRSKWTAAAGGAGQDHSHVPLEASGTVQAWLEVVMAMPMYVKACVRERQEWEGRDPRGDSTPTPRPATHTH